jgi:hypothetical protein
MVRGPRSFASLLLPALLVVARIGYPQVVSRISGTVEDASGAAMPRVKVVVTDIDRGTSLTTVTNDVGRYSFPNLGVGDYRVTAEMAGFKKATTGQIRLDVNQSVDADIKMEVGDITQQVEVAAGAPLLQTSDSQVGALIDAKRIQDLPLAARDFMQLALGAPGVVESRGNLRHQTERGSWIGSFSVHGQSSKYNQYLFDGLPGKEMQHETNIFSPSVDSIQEIKVETSNYNAEFGSEAGGQLNVVIKSGTNQVHGSVFEFLRNDKMDAKEKFADRKSELRRNTFGAAVGGPIRRDKTFYFGSWESMRLRQGFTQNTTVPTKAFRDGDFSSLLGTDFSNTPIALYDWTTRQPFQNNIIPKSRINPFTTRFIDGFVPAPIRAGRGGIRPIDNYQSLAPQQTRTDQAIGRVDHTIDAGTRVYGRYALSDTDTVGPPVWPTFGYSHKLRGQHTVANVSRTLSPSSIFEFRAGYSRFRQTELTESAFVRDVSKELGLKGACSDPACWHAPYFGVTDFSTMGNPSGQTQGQGVSGPRGWKNEIFQIHSSLFLTRGKHTIKAGFTGNRYRDTFPESIRPAGQHTFNGQWTASGALSRGFAFADVLLGLPRQIMASIDIFDPNFRNSHVMPWAQDDWKITSRLTLNLGLRYEWMGKPQSKYDSIANFYQTGPGTAQIITPRDTGKPGFTKKPDSLGRSLLMNDSNNFAPRVGFAYQARPNMVVRGAYGVFYQRDAACTWIGLSINPPYIRTGDVTLNVDEQSIRDFPVDDLTPVVNFVAPGSRPSLIALNVDWHEAYIQQWNLYVERSLGQNFVVKAGYVGNHDVGLRRSVANNAPPPGPGAVQGRRPFQNISSIDMRATNGPSTYHGLELEVQKRYSGGLSFLSSYTWSKTLDDLRALDLWFSGSWKGISDLNIRHRFSFSAVWEAPYGRGRKFGASAPAVANAVLGGWQLSSIVVLRTGYPLTVTSGGLGNVANTDGITQVPNRIREPKLPRGERTETRYFDTGAFTAPAPFTLGNAGQNPIFGPGYWGVDLSLGKVFPVKERLSVQYRAEFFNVLNHPNWGDPGTSFGSATFGRITSTTGDPRVIQMGLKLLF